MARTGSNTGAGGRDFGSIALPQVERNRFFWRVNRKHTLNAGQLVPCFRQRYIPGDTFNVFSKFFVRFASALVKPVMDNATCYVYYFDVPDRIIFPPIKQFFGEVGIQDYVNNDYATGAGYKTTVSGTPVTKYNIGGDDIPPSNTVSKKPVTYLDVLTNPEYGLPFVKVSPDAEGAYSAEQPFAIRSLYDYFALPYRVLNDGYAIQALPLLAYNSIYNHYFRDENIQAPCPSPWEMGVNMTPYYDKDMLSSNTKIYDSLDDYNLGSYLPMDMFKVMPVCKYNDFFTRMLPFQQKGDKISIGLSGTAPVYGSGLAFEVSGDPNNNASGVLVTHDTAGKLTIANASTGSNAGKPIGADVTPLTGAGNKALGFVPYIDKNGVKHGAGFNGRPFGRADLSQVQALDITQIRLGFQLQRTLEMFARAGTRYDEFIESFYGVQSDDSRLQKPRYLGGFKFLINVNPVVQNSATVGQVTPLGDLAAFGVGGSTQPGFKSFFKEFGTIIGLMCIRTNLSYQQMLHPDWTAARVTDYYIPTLAHLSEKAYPNRTLCTTGIFDYDNSTFGFLPQYEHYRTAFDEICCEFRSNSLDSQGNDNSLDVWHYGEFFDTSNPGTAADNYKGLPHLNAQFLKQPSNVVDRALSVTSEAGTPQFLCDITHEVKAVRPISKYGEPGYVDHF